MKRFLKVQPLITMQQSYQQIIVMLEPAFCSGHIHVIDLLCDMLKAIYKPFPVPTATQPAELPKEVHVSYRYTCVGTNGHGSPHMVLVPPLVNNLLTLAREAAMMPVSDSLCAA